MMRMRGQEEIPGWVVHVLDVGARTKERWPRFAGVFPKNSNGGGGYERWEGAV